MIMQNFGVTNKEHYGMLWYFLEWSITKRKGRGMTALAHTQSPLPGRGMEKGIRVGE